MTFSVSIIGSFRRYYETVVLTAKEFESMGVRVSSPAISRIVNPRARFVRFEVDSPQSSDQLIQAVALDKILGSDLVYVVAPSGYVGRSTCYELGRVHERHIPIYFSDIPRDLPIAVPPGSVLGVHDLVRKVSEDLITFSVADRCRTVGRPSPISPEPEYVQENRHCSEFFYSS
jgi:hypothetical protein